MPSLLGSRKEVISLAIKFEAAQVEEPQAPPAGWRTSLVGWVRDLIRPEPAEERRRRIEAEAAAQLGLDTHTHEHAG